MRSGEDVEDAFLHVQGGAQHGCVEADIGLGLHEVQGRARQIDLGRRRQAGADGC